MTHLGFPTKVIRLQGGWKKSNEMMTDLYMRESQSFVLQGQIRALDMLRRGAELKILVGESIDSLPAKLQKLDSSFAGDAGTGPLDTDMPSFTREEISRAMERCGSRPGAGDDELPLSPDLCPDVLELCEDFRDGAVVDAESITRNLKEEQAAPLADEIETPDEPPHRTMAQSQKLNQSRQTWLTWSSTTIRHASLWKWACPQALFHSD